jgi:gluconokinase
MVLIVMGVAGCGKSSVARAVAARLGFELIEGDDLHPPGNLRKMREAVALTDEDRGPWLEAIARAVDSIRARGGSAVVTCSALRQSYRDRLARPDVQFVYLRVGFEVAQQRLHSRPGHFFAPALLQSQFDTLEEPCDALTVDGERSVEQIADEIVERVRHR